ncbi:terminase small subunit [Absicoccus porci]|uniref:Terminase small subunit n=1 Tax=Absicoccus porci TaxID=2486576 RepID=A0A3N0I2G8_9FIRM|nr:terminase small subunit [Absicoccus porci]RNM30690.1 terminase small subunit [Absicoccus porci]
MTEKQMLFAEEYLKDLNATRAYLAVYKNVKSERVASACASKLLTKANVKAYIEDRLEKIHDEKTADAKEVIEYLTSVMRGESKSEVLSLCGSGCQEVIEKKPEERDRLKAAELIGKRYGLFTDRFQIESEKEELSKLDQLLSDITNVAKGDGS